LRWGDPELIKSERHGRVLARLVLGREDEIAIHRGHGKRRGRLRRAAELPPRPWWRLSRPSR
jgi:hypothetical protein